MVGNTGSKKDEPRRYFSTLYYSNQESRKSLPTAEEQTELQYSLPTLFYPFGWGELY